jgi:hypothetical protein
MTATNAAGSGQLPTVGANSKISVTRPARAISMNFLNRRESNSSQKSSHRLSATMKQFLKAVISL